MIAKLKLDFEILFDEDNVYAESIGLKHGFTDDLKEVYGKFGLNLDSFNGNSKWELPIASRFVVDQTGIVRAADVNADYTKRPEPTETVDVHRSFAS